MKDDSVLSLATVSYTLTLHAGKLFMLLLSSADFFQKFFREHYQSVKQFGHRSGPTECWVQTVCKVNEQTTEVTTSKERVNS